jgi:hypothetical protein
MNVPILDARGATSVPHQAAHLTGPLQTGATHESIPLDAAGMAAVRAGRHLLVLVALAVPLGIDGVQVTATVDPGSQALTLPPVTFAPWTEAGAALAIFVPPSDPVTGIGLPRTVALTGGRLTPDGPVDVPSAELGGLVELQLVEGILGRLLVVMSVEKARIRRTARQILAARALETAQDDALDRHGSDIGVARFTDDIVVQGRQIGTVPRREPDEEYRRRLVLYRKFLRATRRHVAELLNGPGPDDQPNAGPLARLGMTARFTVREGDEPFAVAVHMVSGDTADPRNRFLEYIRAAHLLWPQDTPTANAVHAARLLPSSTRARVEALRATIRATATFIDDAATDAAMAPGLAAALARVGRCRTALGVTTPLTVTRAQADVGSRFELGTGIGVALPAAAELQALADAVSAGVGQDTDPDVSALIRTMTPAPVADDPEGAWFYRACGLRTVHRSASGTLYLSHLPNAGLVITGDQATDPPATVTSGTSLQLESRYQAPGDPGTDAALLAALSRSATAWAAAGGTAWTTLSDADAPSRWAQARPLTVSPPEPIVGMLVGAGLVALADPTAAVRGLGRLPPELVQTLQLDPALAAGLIAGDGNAANALLRLVRILRTEGVSSALPLVTAANDVLLVVGAIGLPGAGLNLNEQRATGFRWYVVPLQGPHGLLRTLASRAVFTPSRPGLWAIIVLAFARASTTVDPYQYQLDLPAGATLDLRQYEFLMNLLGHVTPVGVQVNTYALRQDHVDIGGLGPGSLPPTASHTFRAFRSRSRGLRPSTPDRSTAP